MRLELLTPLSGLCRHRRFFSSDAAAAAAAARELLRAGLRARREAAAFGEEDASASIAPPASIAPASIAPASTSSSPSASSSSSTKSQLAAALVAAHASSKRSPGGEARFVSVLCSDFGVNREELARAVEAWRASSAGAAAAAAASPSASSSSSPPGDGGDDASAAAAEERLRRASTPSYESFWPAVAGVPGGLGTLAELRAAALEGGARRGGGRKEHSRASSSSTSSPSSSSSPSPRRRAALAASLARSLAPALASGTSLVRIGGGGGGNGNGDDDRGLPLLSRAASAAQAALHPVRSPADWRARLEPPRACFALLHERGFGRGVPLATVAAFSGAEVARRVSEVLPPLEEGEEEQEEKRSSGGPSVTLYALCSAHAGLGGLDVGRAAARGAAEALARGGGLSSDLPAATRIATLSPLPGFLPWLRACSGSGSARRVEFRREEVEAIREAAAAAKDRRGRNNNESAPLPLLLSVLDSDADDDSSPPPPFPPDLLRPVLLRLAASFLALETVRGMPLDPVARFHTANGAALARLCWRADDGFVPCPQRARRVRKESVGIMVNYTYLWPGGEEPLALPHRSSGRMRVSEGVARLLADEGEEGSVAGRRWGLVD